jgi:hypothetical protein
MKRVGVRECGSARVRRRIAAGAMVLGAACAKKDADTPPPNFSNPAAPAQPAPAKYALADFAKLRYLEGTWRGTMPNGKSFYESYHFINDSTIKKGGHTDSTFAVKSDSSLIMFRNGAVLDSGTVVSTVDKLDSTVADFRTSPTYHFTWTRESNDAWTARLFSKQSGAEQVTTYPMKRLTAVGQGAR